MRAFDAGWGGVVTKTIGLHPVVNVAGPKTKFLRATPDSSHLSMQKRARHGAALVVELGAHLRQDARLVGAADQPNQEGASRRAFSWPRSWRVRAATRSCAHWQTLATRVSERRGRRARAESVVSAHGPQGHGLEHRQGPGADLDRRRGREGGRAGCRSGPSSRPPRPILSSRRGARFSAAPTRSRHRTRFPRCRSSIPRHSNSR